MPRMTMQDRATLERTLTQIDGRGYGAYKQLIGTYRLGSVSLAIDHVQVDPFAPPSRMRVIVDAATAGLPADLIDDPTGRRAVADFLTRRFAEVSRTQVPKSHGTGNSGVVSIGQPGQQILDRTSILITPDSVEARIDVGLPAAGRRTRGREAATLLTRVLPQVATAALVHANLDQQALRDQVVLHRDQEWLRDQLDRRGLVAFVGNGASLPRKAGDSDLPLTTSAMVPFSSPESLRVNFELPSGRRVSGMGVPEGIMVIVGGGYHGKSTLLRAIERGVYPHIVGDGREWVITRADAATIRAEDGRAVTGVDISPFITNLPSGTDTHAFSTTNASGSTSQAANLMEAVEAGASALLIDEDTSATNFMIRDERMRALIPADREPITPFVDRIRPLYTELGVSTVLVAGGSGAFFDVADHVIALDSYVPRDVTAQAHALAGGAGEWGSGGAGGAGGDGGPLVFGDEYVERVPVANCFRGSGKQRSAKAKGSSILFAGEVIDVSAVAQLVDPGQVNAIARVLDRVAEMADGRASIDDLIGEILDHVESDGLDWLSPYSGHPGHMTMPREHEIHAAISRFRGLRLT